MWVPGECACQGESANRCSVRCTLNGKFKLENHFAGRLTFLLGLGLGILACCRNGFQFQFHKPRERWRLRLLAINCSSRHTAGV